ncbi:DUF2065 family protein [Alphaproteobacteria bacterium]|jgi:uncharacterized protein YjeT (DUF2065 family)|nr:DUF2065 family protein [Alphaproteobacteria bacterium]
MLKLVLLGIGLLLFFEGIIYFFLSGNLKIILEQLNKVDPQKIKTISLIMIIIGACLIYFTLRFYGEL